MDYSFLVKRDHQEVSDRRRGNGRGKKLRRGKNKKDPSINTQKGMKASLGKGRKKVVRGERNKDHSSGKHCNCIVKTAVRGIV